MRRQLNRSQAAVLVAARDGLDCRYCGRDLSDGRFSLDHVDPSLRGWDPDNLVIACTSCNSRKSSNTPQEWIDREHEKALWEHHWQESKKDLDEGAFEAAIKWLVEHPEQYNEFVRDRRYYGKKWEPKL